MAADLRRYVEGGDMRSLTEIEAEMTELYPKKEIAKIDYFENVGSQEELRDRFLIEYKKFAEQWNALVDERRRILYHNQ